MTCTQFLVIRIQPLLDAFMFPTARLEEGSPNPFLHKW